MPNHITNILKVTGPEKDVEKFFFTVSTENPVVQKYWADYREREKARLLKQIEEGTRFAKMDLKRLEEEKTADCALDFNGTVPMPLEVRCTTYGSNLSKEELAQQEENKKKYGSGDWYGWACRYWGTKWGAYDVGTVDGGAIRFDTAWSPPTAWLFQTAKQFPTLNFSDDWIDEGGGAGQFSVWTENGEILTTDQPISDPEWRMAHDDG